MSSDSSDICSDSPQSCRISVGDSAPCAIIIILTVGELVWKKRLSLRREMELTNGCLLRSGEDDSFFSLVKSLHLNICTPGVADTTQKGSFDVVVVTVFYAKRIGACIGLSIMAHTSCMTFALVSPWMFYLKAYI